MTAMAAAPPEGLRLDGVLFFPVTPFDRGGGVAEKVLALHVERGVAHAPGGVFAACGTGELHALSAEEYSSVIEVAVGSAAGQVAVIAGAGGGLPQAIECARRAAVARAEGVLLLPPYLASGPPEGVAAFVEAVADASALPVIVYQRANAQFTPATAARVARHPNVVGFKDGLGDFDRMQRIIAAVRAEVGPGFLFFNGLPTAELTAAAYRGIGVHRYSSAVFGFAPEIANAFYRSLHHGDGEVARRLLERFYSPLVELRDAVPGYAVSLVKAGVRLSGLDVGGVRPPLVDPTPDHVAQLRRIIDAGLEEAGAR